MTKAESRLWRRLKSSPYMEGWFPQRRAGKYCLDFYNSKAHISVEVDGRHHQDDPVQVAHDRKRTAFLDRSYHIDELRFTNRDVFRRIDWVLKQIVLAYRQALARYKDPAYWLPVSKRRDTHSLSSAVHKRNSDAYKEASDSIHATHRATTATAALYLNNYGENENSQGL